MSLVQSNHETWLDRQKLRVSTTKNPCHRPDMSSDVESGNDDDDETSAIGSPGTKEENGSSSKLPYLRASQRPVVVVARRNARERKRVHTVNQAFLMLKFHVPALRSRTKRVSKLKILKAAIDYIYALSDILEAHDANAALMMQHTHGYEHQHLPPLPQAPPPPPHSHYNSHRQPHELHQVNNGQQHFDAILAAQQHAGGDGAPQSLFVAPSLQQQEVLYPPHLGMMGYDRGLSTAIDGQMSPRHRLASLYQF